MPGLAPEEKSDLRCPHPVSAAVGPPEGSDQPCTPVSDDSLRTTTLAAAGGEGSELSSQPAMWPHFPDEKTGAQSYDLAKPTQQGSGRPEILAHPSLLAPKAAKH